MKLLYIFAVLSFLINTGFGQSSYKRNPFSGTFAVTAEGGATIATTDFKDMKPGFIGKGEFEYFFPSGNIGAFGLRVFGGLGTIAGKGGATGKFPNIDEFKTDLIFGGLGVEYIFNLGVVNPYIFGGASYLNFNPKDENGNKLPGNAAGNYKKNEINYNAEAGLRFLVSDNFSINLSGATHISPNDVLDDFPNSITGGEHKDVFYTVTAGFSYYFGARRDADDDGIKDNLDLCPDTPFGIAVDEYGCPVDSDKDGVPDYQDDCPNTPSNAKVDNKGCPVDSDKDGVPDYQDNCSNTPANVKVDNKGCPIDSDNDGVPDYKDNCPDTFRGAKVDSNGCVVEVKIPKKEFILSGSANFEFGKTTLTPNAKKILSEFVKEMKGNPSAKYKIEGYTDNVGSEAYNKKLSLQRAQAVLDYFVEQGLSKMRFEVYGRGSENPIGDNNLEFGRALNRRVTIKDVNFKGEEKVSAKPPLKNEAYDYSKDKIVENTIFTDGRLFTIQVSSWETRNKAESEVNKLQQKGYNVILFNDKKNDHYRVRIGYFQTLEDAKAYIQKNFAP